VLCKATHNAGYDASSSSLLASAALAEINETPWSRRGSSDASSLLASVAAAAAANARAREQARRRRGGRRHVLAPCFRGSDLGRRPVALGCDSCSGDVRRGDVTVRMWSGLRRRWSSGTSTSAEMERRWREACEGRGSIAERERGD
jgi:hypothetical protein